MKLTFTILGSIIILLIIIILFIKKANLAIRTYCYKCLNSLYEIYTFKDSIDATIGNKQNIYCANNSVSSVSSVCAQSNHIVFGHNKQLPIINKSQPLPHNGLFVRRNNAFGTKLAFGIKELIEQGIIIDQTNIRFDDFVASQTEQVLSPQLSQAIAVSYGITAIQPSYKYHEESTHYLEIALKATESVRENSPKHVRPSVNYVFVVDVSGSMEGEKLDTVKNAIQEIYLQMLDSDIIGIIVFDGQVKTLLKATPKGQITPDEFIKTISRLQTGGSTDINLALSFGMDELSRYGKPGLVNYLYLFSDGQPNSGETDWLKIRQNVANKARGNLSLHAFGFGSDANMRELDALAGVTGGRSTFVAHAEDVRLSLRDDLNRRNHLVALNIQMQIEIDPSITILHLYGHDLITDPASRAAVLRDIEVAKQKAREQTGVESQPDIVIEDKGIRIFAPDLAVGETYWVVFELALPPDKNFPNLGNAVIQYVDAVAKENKKPNFVLSKPGTIPSDVVILHGIGLWTSEVTFYALDDLYQNDYETARSRIDNHIKTLEAAKAYAPSPQLTDDIITLRKFVSLTANLGKPRAFSDSSFGGAGAYAMYALNCFGQVRNGFMRANYSTTV